MAKVKTKTERKSEFAYTVKLKDIKKPASFEMFDFYAWHESEYGDSAHLSLIDPNGKKCDLWLNRNTTAGKRFAKAIDDGTLEPIFEGNRIKIHFRPTALDGDHVMVRLDFGRVIKTLSEGPGDDSDGVPF